MIQELAGRWTSPHLHDQTLGEELAIGLARGLFLAAVCMRRLISWYFRGLRNVAGATGGDMCARLYNFDS
jgi:Mg/Co/Ni transporter MgtE